MAVGETKRRCRQEKQVAIVKEIKTEEAEDTFEEKNVSQKRKTDYAKRGNLSNLFRAYSSDSDRYSGMTTDNFDRKYLLFLDRFDQSDVLFNDRSRAFPIMLNRNACQFYSDSLRSKNFELNDLVKFVKQRFYTLERCLALVREWTSLLLHAVFLTNLSKAPSGCLKFLLFKL